MSDKQQQSTDEPESVQDANLESEDHEAAAPVSENPDSVKAEEPATTKDEVGSLLKKLEEVSGEVSEQKERYLRAVADLENYRKRAIREKDETRRQANVGLVEDLLPILDNFKLGLKSAESHEGGAAFAEGFRMILTQLESALEQNGLVAINPGNVPFDPNFHEALAHLPHGEIEDGYVIEVQRIGYKLHDRLLRPASVIISSGVSEAATASGEKGSDSGE